jgi:hypothetical protein
MFSSRTVPLAGRTQAAARDNRIADMRLTTGIIYRKSAVKSISAGVLKAKGESKKAKVKIKP